MNLNDALAQIAGLYDLDTNDLIAYAAEDEVGGFNFDETLRKWQVGSIWEVEGKILYALIRTLKPKYCVEIGSWLGCSSHHIAEALLRNGSGKLTCVDLVFRFEPPGRYANVVKYVQADLFTWKMPQQRIDFLFEDAAHSTEQVAHVWSEFAKNAKLGAMIVSHDAKHYLVGEQVRAGIEQVTEDYQAFLVEPSDCGLALWRKP